MSSSTNATGSIDGRHERRRIPWKRYQSPSTDETSLPVPGVCPAVIAPDRRTLLRGLGLLGTAAVAGCTDDSPGVGPAETDGSDDDDGGTEPAGDPVLELQESTAPNWVERGETFHLELVVENTGGAAGTYEDVLIDRERGVELAEIELEVPAGETARWESPPIGRDRIPFSGRIDLGAATADWSVLVDVVQPLMLGETHVYADGIGVRIDALVLKDSFEYLVGGSRSVLGSDEGASFLFVYLTVDTPDTIERSLPDTDAIGLLLDGERLTPITPQFYPADEPFSTDPRRKLSRITRDDIADGLAAYDPAIVEESARTPPEDWDRDDRNPIYPGESSWVLYSVPETTEIQNRTVLLGR